MSVSEKLLIVSENLGTKSSVCTTASHCDVVTRKEYRSEVAMEPHLA